MHARPSQQRASSTHVDTVLLACRLLKGLSLASAFVTCFAMRHGGERLAFISLSPDMLINIGGTITPTDFSATAAQNYAQRQKPPRLLLAEGERPKQRGG